MNPAGDWRYVYASVRGVAHASAAIECQDACTARLVSVLSMPESGPLLLLAAADGAGSAARAREGAERACQLLLDELATRLLSTPPNDWNPTLAGALLESIRTALAQEASTEGSSFRDYACTLLGAAVAADHGFFLQIGDGAIIIGNDAGYQPVFWPQTGQYANETRFVTDPDAGDYLQCRILAEPVAEIALLTDGLQPLALHYQLRQAHVPFFRPLFQQLRAVSPAACSEASMAALESFLDSPAVNQRTHDDKTLMLATRLDLPAGLEASAQANASEPPSRPIPPVSEADPAVPEADPAVPETPLSERLPRDANGAEVL